MSIFLILCCILFPAQQYAVVIEQTKTFPESSSYGYELIDLGETDIPFEQLNRYALPVSYAPQINDQRQATFNQKSFGGIKGDAIDFMHPQISSAKGKSYGINNSGDLLLAFELPHSEVDWWIWSQQGFNKIGVQHIDLGDLPGHNLHLRSLNDSSMAVGAFKPSGMLRPIVWTPEDGLHHLGYYLGWDISGILWDVNNDGTVVGYIVEGDGKVPFVWSKKRGIDRLTNFSNLWKESAHSALESEPTFADLVLSEDNLLYGTFWADKDAKASPTKSFWWNPYSGSFRQLDLQGMRINAISPNGTLVGALNEQAALCDKGNKPVLIADLVKGLGAQWKLLDATDINTSGDIVGYALYQDKPHLFMLKRKAIH